MSGIKYRARPITVEALLLRAHGADQWDEVAEFLGLDPNSGRGEDATMRRPRAGAPGFVRVAVHRIGNEACAGDYLMRYDHGTLSWMFGPAFDARFASVDPEADARALYERSSLYCELNQGWDEMAEEHREHFRARIAAESGR
jgi:hypothetical protein